MNAISSELPASGRRTFSVDITVRTMLIASALIAAGWAFVSVRPAILTLFPSLFSALVPAPVVALVQRRTKPGRGAAATIVVLGLVALAILFLFVLMSPIVSE